MVSFKHRGDFKKTTSFLTKAKSKKYLDILERYGREGVLALAIATPVDSGTTAASWNYEIVTTNDRVTLAFNNSNIVKHVPIAIILQYGHATRNGGWVQGRDYINPAVRPIFDELSKKVWGEVIAL